MKSHFVFHMKEAILRLKDDIDGGCDHLDEAYDQLAKDFEFGQYQEAVYEQNHALRAREGLRTVLLRNNADLLKKNDELLQQAIGALGEADKLVRWVHDFFEEHQGAMRLRLNVRPGQVDRLRDALKLYLDAREKDGWKDK